MLTFIHQNSFAFTLLYKKIFAIILASNISCVFADSQISFELVHKNREHEELINSIPQISLSELKPLKYKFQKELILLPTHDNTLAISEEKLLQQLIKYDTLCLKISEIIKQLVKEYRVTGSFKSKLLGFANTFQNSVKPAQNNINTLNGFISYKTHFAATYISFIYTINENTGFYAQYRKDINDPSSIIGSYRIDLKNSFDELEILHKSYLLSKKSYELKNLILIIDDEIRRRNANNISSLEFDHRL